MKPAAKTEHPHIERRPGVCGGSAVIEGTRIPVRLIVAFSTEGMAAEGIREAYPHLSLAQIFDALSYYHDHRDEIDQELRESSLESILKKHDLVMDDRGLLRPRA